MEVVVEKLHKTYRVHRKEAGLKGSVKSLFKREWVDKHAVKEISFEIQKGEIVGLLGANGAGKTTLAKMLSGIIHPTSGKASILGHTPWERSNDYRRQMTLLMGQKASLWWDLPASDSYLLLKDIYQISDHDFKQRIGIMSEMLDIKEQLNIQIRRLSLGERMKVELVASLLHNPQVIFLDEPTIGLDLTSQNAIRNFIQVYRNEFSPIIILTSHYMQDIEDLCKRIIIMKEGEKIYDGKIDHIRNFTSQEKIITLTLDHSCDEQDIEKLKTNAPQDLFTITNQDNLELQIRMAKKDLNRGMNYLLNNSKIQDLQISDIEIGTIIEHIQREGIRAQ